MYLLSTLYTEKNDSPPHPMLVMGKFLNQISLDLALSKGINFLLVVAYWNIGFSFPHVPVAPFAEDGTVLFYLDENAI